MQQDDSAIRGNPSGQTGSHPQEDVDEAREILADLGGLPDGALPAELTASARQWSDRQAFEALSQVSRLVASNLDLTTLVQQILDLAIECLGAERGILFLGGDPGSELVPAVARSISGQELDELEQISRTILQYVLAGRSIESGDALADPLLKDIPSISLAQVRTLACVPLIAHGKMRGAIYLDNRPLAYAFPEASRRFLASFADLAAVALENAELHGEVLRENLRLRQRLSSLETFGRIVAVSPAMLAVLKQASLVAQTEAPVMILGESGTGKELLARAIHEGSPRAQQPFVAHNCAAVPEHLMESLFFGYVRGAYTSAVGDSQGLFRLAHQGVLFLDEVADLDCALQAKLLRVLEDGRIRPLGSDEEVQVDVRLITATSKDLQRAVADGRFREELFFRTNVLEIQVPPLRERSEDIPILVDHFLRKHSPSGDPRVRFSPAALAMLQQHAWPGNVRELENLVRRALALVPGPVAGSSDVEKLFTRPIPRGDGAPIHHQGQPGSATAARPPLAPAKQRDPTARPPVRTLADQERLAIEDALQRTKGNKSEAARLLGLHRSSLLRRMKRLGIDARE